MRARQNLFLPGIRRNFETLQLSQRLQQTALAAQLRLRSDVLPTQQPAHELRCRHRLNLLAQRGYRKVMDARQQPPLAPLDGIQFALSGIFGVKSGEVPAQDRTCGFQRSKAFSTSDCGNPNQYASAPAVIGPQCIIQPVIMARTASSREAVFDGKSGGVTSNCASGKISAKSLARSDAT